LWERDYAQGLVGGNGEVGIAQEVTWAIFENCARTNKRSFYIGENKLDSLYTELLLGKYVD